MTKTYDHQKTDDAAFGLDIHCADRTVPLWLLEKWQSIVDAMAELADVPAGLIMRASGDKIEVFVSSRSDKNPYKVGESEKLSNSGLYCERVIKTRDRLSVPNALKDENWKDNPDIKLDMIFYLGLPILWPDCEPFGTICILDSRERDRPAVYERLLGQFRDVIEHQLTLLFNDTHRERQSAVEREEQRAALQSSEERFHIIVDQAADAFIMHDQSGSILDANRQACSHAGLDLDELRTRSIQDLRIDQTSDWNEGAWKNAEPGNKHTALTRYWRDADHCVSVEVRWSCQLVQGRKLFLALICDISARARAEDAVRAAEARLARASRLTVMGQLAGSIIHEINQPLAAIATSAEACVRWLKPDAPDIDRARESAARLSDSARHTADVVTRLRALARKSSVELRPTKINDILRSVARLTQRQCEATSVKVELDLAKPDPIVRGDAVQLEQVLINLVLNAIEALADVHDRPRSLNLNTKVRDHDEILVRVVDNGPGIPAPQRAQIFESLFTTKTTGMGMGLFISQSIIRAHARNLEVRSRRTGPGAAFVFSLPVDGTADDTHLSGQVIDQAGSCRSDSPTSFYTGPESCNRG